MARLATRGKWKYYPHIQLFNYLALEITAGNIQNLIVMMPPQHGKSQFWSRFFPAYFIGNHPDRRVILSSYKSSLAKSWGTKVRDLIQKLGKRLFCVKVRHDAHRGDDWSLAGTEGGMITAGVEGGIAGWPANLGIIDDPIKGHEQAESQTLKDSLWDWYSSEFCSRIHEGGIKVVISTRWAQDDLIGRLIQQEQEGGKEHWTVVRLPAIAEEDENFFDIFTRQAGDTLCPELFSLDTMKQRRDTIPEYWWATLYQQRPYPRAGRMFQPAKIRIVDEPSFQTSLAVRGWDLAASVESHAKRTAGVRIEKGSHPRKYLIRHSKIGQWGPEVRNETIRQTMEMDTAGVFQRIEQEGGSSGIDQRDRLLDELERFPVHFERVSGRKELRAEAVAASINRGEWEMIRGEWNQALVSELESFPNGRYKDQVDALSLAFNWLVKQTVAVDDVEQREISDCECRCRPHKDWCFDSLDDRPGDREAEGHRARDFANLED